MELKEKIEFCNKCENRKFNSKIGVTCSLTDNKPSFITNCNNFKENNEYLKKVESEKIKKELNNSFPKGAVTATLVTLIIMIIKFILNNN
jgi:hypothetical protein